MHNKCEYLSSSDKNKAHSDNKKAVKINNKSEKESKTKKFIPVIKEKKLKFINKLVLLTAEIEPKLERLKLNTSKTKIKLKINRVMSNELIFSEKKIIKKKPKKRKKKDNSKKNIF
jgi:hypothetical protein